MVETDGELEAAYHSLDVAQLLEAQIWGQGFPPPLFCDSFGVESQRVVGERHLKLRLREGRAAARGDALQFARAAALARARRLPLSVNDFNGLKRPQITFEAVEPASGKNGPKPVFPYG